MMIGKTITFQVHHIDPKGKHTKTDKTLTGTVMRYDGKYFHVSVNNKQLPYKVHPDWIIEKGVST